MSSQNPSVDAFIGRAKLWRGEIQKLRAILLDCGLDEALKWGKPCFMFEGRNIAIIQPFKEHCSLMFFKGSLLQDTHGRLRNQGENTQAAMRLEFTSEAQKPLVLRGARQVGKSTLVRKAAEALGVDLWEVNLERHAALAGAFESLDVGRILMELGLVLRRSVGQGRGLLFLDEIQALPQALSALRYFHEERPDIAGRTPCFLGESGN
jgi:uncharacterized protein YdeI (YjbR/CyaY-like superfamily)